MPIHSQFAPTKHHSQQHTKSVQLIYTYIIHIYYLYCYVCACVICVCSAAYAHCLCMLNVHTNISVHTACALQINSNSLANSFAFYGGLFHIHMYIVMLLKPAGGT